MNEIVFLPERQPMTISPDYDDATGEFRGFDAHRTQPFAEEEEGVPEEKLIQEDYDHPEYESFEVELATVAEEIITTDFAPDPTIAEEIMSVQHDDSSEADLVQHLIYECYQGNLTPEEAFDYAMSSPYDKQELMLAFSRFKQVMNEQ